MRGVGAAPRRPGVRVGVGWGACAGRHGAGRGPRPPRRPGGGCAAALSTRSSRRVQVGRVEDGAAGPAGGRPTPPPSRGCCSRPAPPFPSRGRSPARALRPTAAPLWTPPARARHTMLPRRLARPPRARGGGGAPGPASPPRDGAADAVSSTSPARHQGRRTQGRSHSAASCRALRAAPRRPGGPGRGVSAPGGGGEAGPGPRASSTPQRTCLQLPVLFLFPARGNIP